jgi:DNA repair protein RecO (recombination protein O)
MRPILQPSNIIGAEFRARIDTQLPSLTVELIHSRAPLMSEPLAASALDWATALTAAVLPEGHPYPPIHSALDGLLAAIEAAPNARGWAGALISYESLILSGLGYGGSLAPRAGGWEPMLAALDASGVQLDRHLFADRRANVLAARERLVERLKRAAA